VHAASPPAADPLDWNRVIEAVARCMVDDDTFGSAECMQTEYARLTQEGEQR
jgi:hypothetical protein